MKSLLNRYPQIGLWLLRATLVPTLFVGTALPLSAQDNEVETDEKILELSPFEVSDTTDVGYLATSTLAGSQIRTKLGDVAASVSVVTQEFLQDTGATDVSQIFNYLGNTEGRGNFAFSPTDQRGVPSNTVATGNQNAGTRVRGLTAPDFTRGFFLTRVPADSFNVERLTLNRGPNSVLFGLGSPAGIFNFTPKEARHRDSAELQLRYGRYDSYRAVLDVNKEIIDDMLSVRAIGLYEEQGFQQEPAWEDDRRVHFAVRYNPFKDTTIKFNTEQVEIRANRPSLIPPLDRVTEWEQAGRPTWNPVADSGNPFPEGLGFDFATNQRHVRFFHASPNAAQPDFASYIRNGPPRAPRGPLQLAISSWLQNEDQAFSTPTSLTDTSIFDARKHNLVGSGAFQNEDHSVYNITLEQALPLGFNLSLAYNWEDGDSKSQTLLAGDKFSIQADPNETLISGEPNPFFGQYFVSGEPSGPTSFWDDQEFKAILTYELNLADLIDSETLSGILGRHNLTLLYSDREEETVRKPLRDAANFAGGSVAADLMQDPLDSNSRRIVARRFYFDGNPVPLNVPTEPVLGVPGKLWDEATGTFQETTIGSELWFRGSTASWEKNQIESQAFVWQGYFWDDRIVGTFGFREDDVETFTQDGAPPTDNLGRPVFSKWELKDTPESISAETTTIGVVVKPFEWLNLHYNDSENIVPIGGRLDLFGNEIAPQEGTGEDFGFSLNLLDNKFAVKVNWFEVSQKNVTQDALTSVAFWRIARFEFPENVQADLIAAGQGDLWQPAPAGHPGRVDQLKVVTNFEAEGLELEAVYNPTPNWRILLNVAQQETVQSNLGPAMKEWIDLRLPFFESLPVWNDPNFGPGDFTWEGFWNLIVTEPAEFELAQENTNTAQQREWRFNFVTNYTFTEDFLPVLNGLNVGGAIRWQDSPIIGFAEGPPTATGNPTLDAGSPIGGDSDTTFDFWTGYRTTIWDGRINWNIQLNIQNVFDDDDFIPIRANPDGSIATYRIAQPTNYFITSSFRF